MSENSLLNGGSTNQLCLILAMFIIIFAIGYSIGWAFHNMKTENNDSQLMGQYVLSGRKEFLENENAKTMALENVQKQTHPDKSKITQGKNDEEQHDEEVVEWHLSNRSGNEDTSDSAFAEWKKNTEDKNLTFWT